MNFNYSSIIEENKKMLDESKIEGWIEEWSKPSIRFSGCPIGVPFHFGNLDFKDCDLIHNEGDYKWLKMIGKTIKDDKAVDVSVSQILRKTDEVSPHSLLKDFNKSNNLKISEKKLAFEVVEGNGSHIAHYDIAKKLANKDIILLAKEEKVTFNNDYTSSVYCYVVYDMLTKEEKASIDKLFN